MSAADFAIAAPPDRREQVLRWRRRSRLIRALRLALPGMIGLILAGLAAAVAYNALTAEPIQPRESAGPIRLVNPRFVGRDEKGRAFVITAESATRDPKDYQRVMLDRPALMVDEQGPDAIRLVANAGVYHEGTFKLDLHGGVRLVSSKAAFDTATTLFDTKTGEVVGSGPIQGSGSLGEINAKSYAVYGKGERMIFKGGVHTRLDGK
ncbi:LPS export ABC transporter periplasmic protein LptC [Phenylobacterium sp. LjRoot219]|uniref:LPS export ABC transporter periplasmic protein LptC n=1 Tax=Phenylobacterium sp. LjRoot219 TaxID=3342283 RepID=UPI003ECC19AC